MAELIVNSAVTHTMMLVVPIVVAFVLRAARCPGWPVVAGLVGGVLIGPALLGRIAPDAFEAHFVGGVVERQARDDLARRHGADLLAAREVTLDAAGIAEMETRHEREMAAAQAAWRGASWSFQRPFRSYASAIVFVTLLGAGLLRGPRNAPGPSAISATSIGLWSCLLPGGIAAAVMTWTGESLTTRLAVGAAIGVGPWLLTAGDRAAADAAEHGGARLIRRSGDIASIVAIAALAGSIVTGASTSALVWMVGFLGLPMGWMLPRLEGRSASITRGVLEFAFVPSLAATAAMRIEVLNSFAIVPVIVFVLLSADGRWVGALLGALLPGGRRPLRTMRLVLGSMACGPTQLAVVTMALHTRLMDETIAFGLVIGAVLIEVTAPARRIMSDQLTQSEEELNE